MINENRNPSNSSENNKQVTSITSTPPLEIRCTEEDCSDKLLPSFSQEQLFMTDTYTHLLHIDYERKILTMYVRVYLYSRGGPHTALAPGPSLIYCD
jgi:hypothetical protein